jgi:hypothetical protein
LLRLLIHPSTINNSEDVCGEVMKLLLFMLFAVEFAFGATVNYARNKTPDGREILMGFNLFFSDDLASQKRFEILDEPIEVNTDGTSTSASTTSFSNQNVKELFTRDYNGMTKPPYSYTITSNINSQIQSFVMNLLNEKYITTNDEFAKYIDMLSRAVNFRLIGRRAVLSLGLGDLCEITMTQFDAAVLAMHALHVGNTTTTTNTNTNTNKYNSNKLIYVETGSYLGCSSLFMSQYLSSNVYIYAHDIWVDTLDEWKKLKENSSAPPPLKSNYFYEFYNYIKRNSLEKQVIPIRGKSSYTLGIHDENSVDFAFIDGDHSYEGCLADLRVIWPKMKRQIPISSSSSNNNGELLVGEGYDYSEDFYSTVQLNDSEFQYTSVILIHDCDFSAREELGVYSCVQAFSKEVQHKWHYVEKTGIARFFIQ